MQTSPRHSQIRKTQLVSKQLPLLSRVWKQEGKLRKLFLLKGTRVPRNIEKCSELHFDRRNAVLLLSIRKGGLGQKDRLEAKAYKERLLEPGMSSLMESRKQG